MSRRAVVIQIAPPAPPCFGTRGVWVEFLVSAAEETRGGRLGPVDARVETPTACAVFPREMFRPPRAWVEKHYNVTRWTEMKAGGHFAAMEEPDALVSDVRAFFRDLR